MPTVKLKLNHDIMRNECLLRCPPNYHYKLIGVRLLYDDIALFLHRLRNILIPSHTDVGIPPSQATYSNIDNIMYIIVILPGGSYAVRLVTVAQEINENATSDVIGGKIEFSLSFKPHALILYRNACVALTRCIYGQKLVKFTTTESTLLLNPITVTRVFSNMFQIMHTILRHWSALFGIFSS